MTDNPKRAQIKKEEQPVQRLPTAKAQAQYTALLWAGEQAAGQAGKQAADGAPPAGKKDRFGPALRRFALWCERQAPPGRQAAQQLQVFGWGVLAAAVYSLSFLWRLFAELELFDRRGKWRGPGVKLPAFGELFGTALLGFWLLAAVMAAFAALYYAGLWQGSKSIYLMRRLPQRGELARRCLTLPALGVLGSLLCGGLCAGVHYAMYLLAVWVYG